MDTVWKCILCLQHITLGDIHNDFILKGLYGNAKLKHIEETLGAHSSVI